MACEIGWQRMMTTPLILGVAYYAVDFAVAFAHAVALELVMANALLLLSGLFLLCCLHRPARPVGLW